MTASQRMESMVFQAWRLTAQAQRFKRYQRLRRVLRILRVAVKRRKNLRLMAISALSFKKNVNINILKQCFDALRNNKVNERLEKLKHLLTEDVRPVIDLLTYQVDNMHELSRIQDRQGATKAVMNMCKRKVRMALNEWREKAHRVRMGKKEGLS